MASTAGRSGPGVTARAAPEAATPAPRFEARTISSWWSRDVVGGFACLLFEVRACRVGGGFRLPGAALDLGAGDFGELAGFLGARLGDLGRGAAEASQRVSECAFRTWWWSVWSVVRVVLFAHRDHRSRLRVAVGIASPSPRGAATAGESRCRNGRANYEAASAALARSRARRIIPFSGTDFQPAGVL